MNPSHQTPNKMWHRRQWIARQTLTMTALVVTRPTPVFSPMADLARRRPRRSVGGATAGRSAPLDPASWQTLAQHAVEAAHAAGAQYAEARLTRNVVHRYSWAACNLAADIETVGVGVRALVDGYWGFSASPIVTADELVRLAQDAVDQAKDNAKGPPWTVDLGTIPVAQGTWATPCRIDPFTISIEEKDEFLLYWAQCIVDARLALVNYGAPSWLQFVRQERVVATSEGALFTQTVNESGGYVLLEVPGSGGTGPTTTIRGLEMAGAGWERILDADIPAQVSSGQLQQDLAAQAALPKKPSTVGRYTLVCDGETMAALVEATLGVATQLDRALGYEANAGGTSWLIDPLAMVGHAQVTSPVVTLTANRSVPGELATVQWDEEGVTPAPFTLIKDGVLTDFQTTREQAAWLAPYYQAQGKPIASHGCAGAEDGHYTPVQMMPNLTLEPGSATVGLADLVSDVKDGILLEGGKVHDMDAQVRTGLLVPGRWGGAGMRVIKNGRLGPQISGGAILFDTPDLWKHLQAVGGVSTQAMRGTTPSLFFEEAATRLLTAKGQPPQNTSHTVRAVAATSPNQPLIYLARKA